jgi:hypothetical protein
MMYGMVIMDMVGMEWDGECTVVVAGAMGEYIIIGDIIILLNTQHVLFLGRHLTPWLVCLFCMGVAFVYTWER